MVDDRARASHLGFQLLATVSKPKSGGEDKIKAVIIYPCERSDELPVRELRRKTRREGLRLGLYTGEMAHNPDEATECLRQFGRKEAFDSEVVFREEI